MSASRYAFIHPYHPLHLVIGLIIWSKWFVIMYGGLSVACSVAPPRPDQGALTLINLGLGVLTLIFAALLAWLAWACAQSARQAEGRPRFFALVGSGLYLASLGATLFVGVPVVGFPPCI